MNILAAAGENPKDDEKERTTVTEASELARLISFEALEKRLGESNLRLLDCRPKSDYEQGHIPDALWIDAKALETHAAKPGGLDDKAFWEAWGKSLGLSPETEIYVYDARRQLDAARVWFFLRWIGVERVGLLDGGFPLWAGEKRPVSTDEVTVAPVSFRVRFRKDVAATRDEVRKALDDKSEAILDARSDDEFSGTVKRSKRGGHIPAACHLEWTKLVDDEGRFFDPEILRTKVEKSGIKPGAAVITHCQGGGRASINAFVLERLGFRARNYYPGWSDWGNQDETPVEEE